MPKWIHDRAEHLLAKNPSMSKPMAFAVATQQAHSTGHTPKGYGTEEGKSTAKAKFDTPKDDEQRANPGSLDSPKLAAAVVQVVKQAGLLQRLPQAVRSLPSAAKNVALGAGERNMHMNEAAGLGVLAIPGLDTLQSKLRARLAGDTSPHGAEKRQLMGEGAHAALDVGGLGLLAAPALSHLRKHAFANSGYAGNVAQNGPGMKSHSQLPAFKPAQLQVKVSKASPLKRVGELVTGSRAGRLRESALRHADRAAEGKLPRELKASKKLLRLAKKEEGHVGKVQGALVGSAALGTVSDTTGLAEKVRDRKKEAGVVQRVGELLTGSRVKKLHDAGTDYFKRGLDRAGVAGKALGIAEGLTSSGLAKHPVGARMAQHAKDHGEAFLASSKRHVKASNKIHDLKSKESDKVFITRMGLGTGTAVAGSSALLHKRKSDFKTKKEAGVGVGEGMTTSQYSGPLSYGPFKMTSGIPPFKRPAMTKGDDSLEGAAWMYGGNKEAAAALVHLFSKEAAPAMGAMSPAAKLTSAQRIAGPKTTGFTGPSIADIAKPKGFGQPMPGAQKNQI